MNDSIERIKEDAAKPFYQYWNCANVCSCEKCPSKIEGQKPYEHYETFSCSGAMKIDLIERTIKVMERSMERTCKYIAGFCDYPECTECGESLDYIPNYCPNCGAEVVE